MSVLDLFAAALGAFILIAVILFPNYQKQEKAEIELKSTKEKVEQCKITETATKEVLEQKNKAVAACEAAAGSTFLVIVIEWNVPGNIDIDLHVYDPDGNEFFWGKSNRDHRDYPDTEAQLSYDNTRGPGVELWQHPKAKAGTYRIAYDLYSTAARDKPVEVKGNVFFREGRSEIPAVTLTETHKQRPVAQLRVDGAGNVDVQAEP
jgi:hypothetical protein